MAGKYRNIKKKSFIEDSKSHTVKEQKDYLERQTYADEQIKALKQALQLIDLTKNESRSFSTFSKDTLRTYLQNPKSYESQLRALSQFLANRCYPYYRLLKYQADMIDLNAYSAIPNFNPLEQPNDDEILKDYYDTLIKMRQIDLQSEIWKIVFCAWREDTAFGYIYDDDDTFFIHKLDGDYCRVCAIDGGVLNFAFDFSYFRRYPKSLEYWDSEFQEKYDAYNKDATLRWQELDPEKTFCIKVNIDDPTLNYPVYSPLFENLINLIDLESIQSVKDELSVYKTIVLQMETQDGADESDMWKVSPKVTAEYYQRILDFLPECVNAIVTPNKVDTIEFKGNDTSDTDMISNALKNLFVNTGGSQVLNSDKTSSAIADAQAICDSNMALSSLLPQIEKLVNRYLSVKVGDNHAIVKYMRVTPYTKDKKKKSILESCQNGAPMKLELMALEGYSPIDTMAKDYLENTLLKIHESWLPLANSNQTNGSDITDGTDPIEGGRPKSDSGDLTDEGDASREKT